MSFLSNVGTRLKGFFIKLLPIAETITQAAVKAEPIVDLVLTGSGHPEAALLYNTVSASVLGAETATAAAGMQTGSGTQKAAAVLSDPTVQKAFSDFEAAIGVTAHSTAQQLQYVSAVVNTLNSLNGTPAAPVPETSNPAVEVAAAVAAAQRQAAAVPTTGMVSR